MEFSGENFLQIEHLFENKVYEFKTFVDKKYLPIRCFIIKRKKMIVGGTRVILKKYCYIEVHFILSKFIYFGDQVLPHHKIDEIKYLSISETPLLN